MAIETQPPVTHRGVVQAWECDRNKHWNMRYYLRAFQYASEVLALRQIGRNPGAATVTTRQFRFHRELLLGDVMTIRSARVAAGRYAGAIVHLMDCDNGLAATALDLPSYDPADAPLWPQAKIEPALPRGLDELELEPYVRVRGAAMTSDVTIVRPFELDHIGALLMHEMFGHCTSGSHNLLASIGLSTHYMAEQGLGRMTVEARVSRVGHCAAGDALRVRSWLSFVREKALGLRHQVLNSTTGAPIAVVEQCMVVVNMDTRRVELVPAFLHEALGVHISTTA